MGYERKKTSTENKGRLLDRMANTRGEVNCLTDYLKIS